MRARAALSDVIMIIARDLFDLAMKIASSATMAHVSQCLSKQSPPANAPCPLRSHNWRRTAVAARAVLGNNAGEMGSPRLALCNIWKHVPRVLAPN
eukprot:9194923-Pyramimonas_sp.AAC.1